MEEKNRIDKLEKLIIKRTNLLNREIKQLKKENEALKKRIKKLDEQTIDDLI